VARAACGLAPGQAIVTLQALQTYSENLAAREEMRRRGISYWPVTIRRSLRDWLLLRRAIPVGELNKSWDVLKTVQTLEDHLDRDAPILDLGAYASEVLCSLHLAGFRNLTGIDLNPGIHSMPYSPPVRYITGDMMRTPLADESISAITAISAIEHGFSLQALFQEVSRLLKPGGLFVASTDYWPEKIDTSGIQMYEMNWTIFSKAELEEVFRTAAAYGLLPLGDCDYEVNEPAIECAGKRYTFAWFALQKRDAA
jgi:SAM-dependent methyltransferase